MEKPSLDTAKAGAFRFNTDSSQLEIYDGNQWVGIQATSPFLQTGGTRGLWAGGEESSKTNRIQFVNVDTTGDTSDFGDANNNLTSHTMLASRTRGLISGGFIGPQPTNYSNVIEFVTISSTGNATDYGDMAVFNGGQKAACASATRGLLMGGMYQGVHNNTLEYMTIAQTGNTIDFGDLTSITVGPSGLASQTRGLCFFGNTTPARSNGIDFVTISTLGNAVDFGDLTAARAGFGAGCPSRTRGVFAGGYTPSKTDAIDYVQIMSTGNGLDFGNLAANTQYAAGCSNGHGGL